jgi:riboflavin synthase
MFTGIIEASGKIISINQNGSNLDFLIQSPISSELKVDQSVSHNGVCLTVTKVGPDGHSITAVSETILKTNISQYQAGDLVNLERCMIAGGRFDGHIVQGHVDGIGRIAAITDLNGSWQIDFEFDPSFSHLIVEKGSVCVNGVSLTCFNCGNGNFSVAIIPYTWTHTNFHLARVGDQVNIEFDIIGKYVGRLMKG